MRRGLRGLRGCEDCAGCEGAMGVNDAKVREGEVAICAKCATVSRGATGAKVGIYAGANID